MTRQYEYEMGCDLAWWVASMKHLPASDVDAVLKAAEALASGYCPSREHMEDLLSHIAKARAVHTSSTS